VKTFENALQDTGRKNGEKDRSGVQGDGRKPTEEEVEKLEEKLEAAQADQKNLFLIIFQVNICTMYRQCFSEI
jgi:hypothetical protein